MWRGLMVRLTHGLWHSVLWFAALHPMGCYAVSLEECLRPFPRNLLLSFPRFSARRGIQNVRQRHYWVLTSVCFSVTPTAVICKALWLWMGTKLFRMYHKRLIADLWSNTRSEHRAVSMNSLWTTSRTLREEAYQILISITLNDIKKRQWDPSAPDSTQTHSWSAATLNLSETQNAVFLSNTQSVTRNTAARSDSLFVGFP
jgi:hypothetical protein